MRMPPPRRPRIALASILALASFVGGRARADVPAPSAEAIFSQAKNAWRIRTDAPFVSFNLRERYEWRSRTHDNWWQASYREFDRALALHRLIVASAEEGRLKGTAIGINLRFHNGIAKADSLDTNPNADAFPVLDPQIEPNASFGLVRREPKAALGSSNAAPDANANAPASPRATSTSAPPSPANTATPGVFATEKPLRELARVEAVARDYTIALAGTERIGGTDAYHLTLTPLRDPHLYRLRDLWVDTSSYATLQLAIQGLFEGKPYADARWTVSYTPVDGHYYVQEIRTADTLRFGLDRVVTGLQFDFVAYAFPQTIPPLTFQRMF